MPHAEILVFRQANGVSPFTSWLDDLSAKEPRAYAKCLERILRLSELGYEMRRPLADSLRDGIHELRIKVGTVNYRPLYCFAGGRNKAVLLHGCTKEGEVDDADIVRALQRKSLVDSDWGKHTAEFEIEDDNG